MSDQGLLASRPAHVPEAAVFDFDMFFDPGLLRDPHERVRELLREAPPVFWTPRHNGHWVALTHEAGFQVMRDWERFSSESVPRAVIEAALAMRPAGAPHLPRMRPITLDPPDHTRYRAALAAAFGPRAIKGRREEIQALAGELVGALVGRGGCEVVATAAEPLPVLLFLKMMGLPATRLAEFRTLAQAVFEPTSADPMESAMKLRQIADAIDGEILARRDDPREDLISLLWATEIDGKPMSLEIMEDFSVLLFLAGLDTVINAIGYGVRHLAENPDLQAQLRADPSLVPAAVEELLRRYTFVVPVRRIIDDTEFFGHQLKQNERIMAYLAGSGLDPAEHPNPERIDLKREDAGHTAFGAGPHRCAGSHLARLELQILFAELLARLPEFRLDPDAPAVFRAGNILSIKSLSIRWD
jgi:cytochrome P450